MTEPHDTSVDGRFGRWRVAAAAVAIVLTVAVLGFLWWANSTAEPGEQARSALDTDPSVTVSENDGFVFQPTDVSPEVGFILYPGARVDPASYAAAARGIAEGGYLVVVPELRLNLAVLDVNAAEAIVAEFPAIDRWAMGGHSLGGAMAAQYANEHLQSIDGLVLWAAYPPASVDLSGTDLAAASIFGTRDGLTSLADIDDSRDRLPADTEFTAITGGNHAQFGDYGTQSGDNTATITREEQQTQIVEATLRTLRRID